MRSRARSISAPSALTSLSASKAAVLAFSALCSMLERLLAGRRRAPTPTPRACARECSRPADDSTCARRSTCSVTTCSRNLWDASCSTRSSSSAAVRDVALGLGRLTLERARVRSISLTMSVTRSRFCRVSSILRSACLRRCLYLVMPAASSMKSRRSSGAS